MSFILKTSTTFSMTCIIHDIISHPLPKSKIKKSENKNQNKINRN